MALIKLRYPAVIALIYHRQYAIFPPLEPAVKFIIIIIDIYIII